jgi:hypothetical protein
MRPARVCPVGIDQVVVFLLVDAVLASGAYRVVRVIEDVLWDPAVFQFLPLLLFVRMTVDSLSGYLAGLPVLGSITGFPSISILSIVDSK